MKIKLAYGKTGLEFALPDDAHVTVIESRHSVGVLDPTKAVREALRDPIGSTPLREWVKPADKVAVVFSDITRPTPNHILLPVVLEELSHVPDSQIVLLNGTGTHRPNTDAELRAMLGNAVVDRYRIVQNDCHAKDAHKLVGTTTSGNDIWIHREFAEADARILTGFIEPHNFAGFSGGGKGMMPGVAGLKTILRNHGAQNIDHPMRKWGVTRGNPVYTEIRESAAMLAPLFLLNVTLNRNKEITGVFAGDLTLAHGRGCDFVVETAMVAVDKPFDIMVTCNSGYPLDLNMYQSMKGLEAAMQVLKPGGSVIVAADCWDGIPDHGEYARLLRGASSPESILEMVRKPGFLRHDSWQAQIHASMCLKADIHFYSANLSDEQIQRAFMTPCRDIPATVAALRRRHGAAASIGILPEGPQTVPYVQEKTEA